MTFARYAVGMVTMLNVLLVLGAYLAGSVCSAIIVCRLLGKPDPRSEGSGNPGATNVLRVGGKPAAAATLAGDFLKGLLPVWVAHAFTTDPRVIAAVAVAAVLGHLFPVFFGFRGGKGVATALGVLVGLAWQVGLAVIATWLVMALLFKISSLSALVALLLAPVYVWWWLSALPTVVAAVVITALVYWRHESNIRKLIAGTEDRIDDP